MTNPKLCKKSLFFLQKPNIVSTFKFLVNEVGKQKKIKVNNEPNENGTKERAKENLISATDQR